MKTNTQKLVLAAMFAALCCIATMIIKIPLPFKGYLNLGDCIVLLSGWILSPGYAFLAAGVGSALADVFSGYTLYAPVTFFIKGSMTVIAYHSFTILNDKLRAPFARMLSGILAELVMILGYFLFESILYGFVIAMANVPFNAIQGTAGLILATQLVKVVQKAIK